MGRNPDAVDVLGVLGHVQPRLQTGRSGETRSARSNRVGPDKVDVVVGLLRVLRRGLRGERGGYRKDAEAGVGVPPLRAHVTRRVAHDVLKLGRVELGPKSPNPSGRSGDKGRREARAVEGRVAARIA